MAKFNISKITTELNKTQQKKISSLPSIEIVKSSNSISLFGTKFSAKDTSINIPLITKCFYYHNLRIARTSQFFTLLDFSIIGTNPLIFWHFITAWNYNRKSCGNAIVICYVVGFIRFFISLKFKRNYIDFSDDNPWW